MSVSLFFLPGHTSYQMTRSKIGLIAAAIGVAALAAPHIWRNYLFPISSIESSYSRCFANADAIYGVEIARWRDEHQLGISPLDARFASSIKRCMISEGWLYLAIEPDSVGCDSWCYGPRGAIAARLFEWRNSK